ncbi:unnamed protein product [Dovyalis caffra]|uniref:Uncharacterized protein n=1 Tax=Dovyalis caffra TaxID=77055 RepID=A0AAV1RC67_9ROSI|nr:unnamed protein product [Dovyalis caffra]
MSICSRFPRLAEPLGYVPEEDILYAVKAIVVTQRENRRRDDRKYSRMKYLIISWGIEKFRSVVEQYYGKKFEPSRELPEWEFESYLGWHEQGDGGLFCELHVDSGRNIILCGIRKAWKRRITTALAQAGLLQPKYVDPLKLTAMACPALPLCPLAITEAERGIPDIFKRVRVVFEKVGLKSNESVVIRATGCPSGCARPYMAELGFVGDGPNSYQSYIVYLGSHAHGPRVSKADIDAVADSHQEFIGSYLGSSEKARDTIIYSYDRHINGFAAMLEEEEAAEIARHLKVVSVFLNWGRKLHTTHSWDFMLLEKNSVVYPSSLWKRARFGEDSIIANLDTAKAANASVADALLCKPGSLDHEKAKGKILVCLRGETGRMDKGYQAALVGATGMILCNDKASGNEIIADLHVLPASEITYTDGLAVFAYINSTDHPLGYISAPTAKLGTQSTPFMAAFSSRGPNAVTPEMLKPDITAPGVNIIAAISEAVSPTNLDFDKRKSPFITESGTSMSCPHVAGVVGLLRTLHPDWSPAAIRSAIMTTARTRANTMTPMIDGRESLKATPFSYGAGHIRPNCTRDPGLVYGLSINDYLDFLCTSRYNSTMIEPFADGPYKCPELASIFDFNNSSITVNLVRNSMSVIRKVKNVGLPGTYAVHVREPYGILISVEPNILTFENTGDEKSFKVTFEAKWYGAAKEYEFGSLSWTDGRRYVRSPIVVAFGDND